VLEELVELALGGGLTAGIEYLYADLGDERLGENITRSTDEEFTSRFDTEHHILRATLSYYFCGPEKRGGVFGTADSREDAWNGFFAGLNFGFVSADWKRSGIFDGNELWNKKVSDSAAGGGMQVGYNYYLNRAVLGVVSDFQLTNAEGRAIPASTDDDSEVRLDTPWWGTLRARFGYEIKPEVLLYLTGGLAYGKVEWESYDDNSPPAGVDAKDWIVGWTVGGGAEIAINKRVSLGLEYLYVDLGKTNDLTRKVANSTGDEYTEDVTASMHVPRVSLNFHF